MTCEILDLISYFTLEIIGMRTKSDMLAELDRLERLRAAGNAAIDAAYSWGLFVGAGGMLALISFLFALSQWID